MAGIYLQSTSWRNSGSWAAALLAVLLLSLGYSLGTAPIAAAHDQIISTNPQAAQRLSAGPSHIELSFSAPLLSLGHEILVVDAQSRNWSKGNAVLSGEKLSQPLSPDMPEGEYQVRWRVVSGDGHPISGSYPFLVGSTATAGTVPAPGAPAAVSAPTAGSSAAAGQAVDSPSLPATAKDGFPVWLVAVVGAVIGLGGYLGYLAIQRIRRTHSTT
ncbi:copper resistance CopC family protein [Arthrobacter sp.]|uniref:copper resistance CopC family protein n=1 Tax=Arthrobacter sp. TaxID=1667 RepID=UPI0026E05FCB|nr:copper resistance CopC family protein [Arthrobacter sp.]MDO5754499.1 copper resistance protein CopC [Arthrobacter sp.]